MRIYFAEAKAIMSLRVSSERRGRAHGASWAVFSRTSHTSSALGMIGSDFPFLSHGFQPGAGTFWFISSKPGGAAQTSAWVLTWGDADQLHLSHPSAFPSWLPGGPSAQNNLYLNRTEIPLWGYWCSVKEIANSLFMRKGTDDYSLSNAFPAWRALTPGGVSGTPHLLQSLSLVCWSHLSCCLLTDFSLKQFPFITFILKGWLNTSSRNEKLCLWQSCCGSNIHSDK